MVKILIAEDELLELKYLRTILSKDPDFEVVHQATNGKAAIDYIRDNPVDVVIIDIRMPVMDGLEATKIIKQEHPDIKVIINTAYAEFDLAQAALRNGADEYVVKPAKDYMIISVINTLMSSASKGKETPLVPTHSVSLRDYPLKEEKLVMNAMRNTDLKLLRAGYTDFAKSLLVAAGSVQTIRSFIFDFLSGISRVLVTNGYSLEEVSDLKSTFMEKNSQLRNLSEARTILEEIEESLLQTLYVGDASAMFQTEMIMKYIHHNYNKDISLKSLARRFHFSDSYLSRCIKKQTKTSFPQYLNKLRIEKAVWYLENSSLKIYDIALEVGYHDASHFNRTFKSVMGITPSAYRKKKGGPSDAVSE